ncbi:hypothetical protein [Rhizobium rhizogenes]|uniref:hypothetical protein n=1 Tax=Rhizobium rhizogenes TaxID=359 RepID=UPI0022C2A87D|nr:hypothetical protein [Rhizobium rhizogenes]MCZ7488230.1 hypothetical protein [Rhizobium rhizogenes]
MVTDEMVEKAQQVLDASFQKDYWISGPPEEATKRALEAALSAAEPVGWFNLPNDVHGYQQVAKEHEGKTGTIPLYAAPPAPSVAVKAKPKADDYLISTLESLVEDNIWSGWAIKQAIEIIRKAGEELPYHCDVCTVPGYGNAPCSPLCDRAALSAQVQDVAETEAIAALKEAEPYVEICHSLMTQKETRANVWRVLKQVRAAIAAAPAKQEG